MRHRTRPVCHIANGVAVWRFRCECGVSGAEMTGPEAFEVAKADARAHEDASNSLRVDWSVLESWLRQ